MLIKVTMKSMEGYGISDRYFNTNNSFEVYRDKDSIYIEDENFEVMCKANDMAFDVLRTKILDNVIKQTPCLDLDEITKSLGLEWVGIIWED